MVLLCVVLFMSVSSDTQRKFIRDGDYDIVCHVALKQVNNYQNGRLYYWFKTGEIHTSISNAGGLVLHEEYSKFYRSKQLAEKGNFNYGLKDGEWRNWYENGGLKSIIDWKKGLKNGVYISYDQEGRLVESGIYSNHKKSNMWVNHKLKDTTYYKGDSAYATKPVSKVNGFLNKLFRKRDSTEKAQIKFDRQLKKEADSISRAQRKKEKQDAKEKAELQSNN